MTAAITDIRNIGPAMEAAFRNAGISSASEIRDLGADAAYSRLLASGHRPHFIGYYALVMGLQGRPWNDCHGKEKDDLRRRFEALKRAGKASPSSEFERELNKIGVRLDQPTSSSPEKK